VSQFRGRNEADANRLAPKTNKRLDVASRLLEMW